MNENLERLNRIYPNGRYVLIPKYEPSQWVDKEYDSAFDTKAALNKWTSKPLSYKEACEYEEQGFRIGWVVPKGMVIVDIDNKDNPQSQARIENLLKKFEVKYSYNYTSKGIHILFRDPSESIKSDSRAKCGINIVVDTRANSTGYIILPCNDPHREWGQWNDFVEEIPYFLKPLFKDETKSFIGMTEGDGRNTELFKWRSKLENKAKLLSNKEIEKCIRIINENLFDTPMPNNELFKTVLREHEKNKKAEQENIYNTYANQLLDKYDIIYAYEQFYKFNGIFYETLDKLSLEQLIHTELNKNITSQGRKEIMDFIKIKAAVDNSEVNKHWYKIACKNGILNLVTGELETANKTEYNTTYIPFAYNNDPVGSPRIDQFMKDLTKGDLMKIRFLYQIAGYCLLKKNIFEKFFIFQGEGGTGKSTYMNLLQKLVGGNVNTSHVSLAYFDKDYYLATLVGKLLNVDDDVVDGQVLQGTGRFKSIVSGEAISVRQIYREVISFVPYATLVFSCNRLPRIMDKTSGLYRRLILVELNNKVEKPDPLFINRLTDIDMEYFLFKSVEAIKTAIEEGHFTINTSENELLLKFQRRQSAFSEWIYENDIRLSDIHNKAVTPLYAQFKDWCANAGYNKVPSLYSYKEDICATYNVEVDMFEENGRLKRQMFVRRGKLDLDYKPF